MQLESKFGENRVGFLFEFKCLRSTLPSTFERLNLWRGKTYSIIIAVIIPTCSYEIKTNLRACKIYVKCLEVGSFAVIGPWVL